MSRIFLCRLAVSLGLSLCLTLLLAPWVRSEDAMQAAQYYEQAMTAYEKGDFDTSTKLLEQALAADPKMADGWYRLGVIASKQLDTEKATECYKKALEANPHYAKAHYNLGVFSQAKGNHEEAMTAFKKAYEADPKLFQAYINYGSSAMNLKKVAEAVEAFQAALKNQPEHPLATYNLAYAYYVQGQTGKAKSLAEKVFQLQPTLTEAKNLLDRIKRNLPPM